VKTIGGSVKTAPNKSAIRELWSFARTRKKYWLLPIIMMMLTLGLLIVMAQGSALSPFVYTLF